MVSDLLVNGKRSRRNHSRRHDLAFKLLDRGGLPTSREVELSRPRVDLQWPSIRLRC